MKKWLLLLLFAQVLTACGSTGSTGASTGATGAPADSMGASNVAPDNTPPDHQRVTPPTQTVKGYFSVPAASVDRVEVRRFRFLSDSAPEATITVGEPAAVQELCGLLAGLPVQGDLSMKLAPSVSHTHLRFFSGASEVGQAHIYNGSLQMSDSKFLEKPHPDEQRFVHLVEKLKP
ncbi:MAG: hypothetical protein CVU65_16575 [Deltaproteobacteria bacterium HGW-Deltaproteobacteria-22]|nr:MAG: hypothetical protein CVU65_16575 [Deltaproteobacteria bacterium HGW-Deltaproteobacteria-22]